MNITPVIDTTHIKESVNNSIQPEIMGAQVPIAMAYDEVLPAALA
jgi:hypothetical protein